MYDAIIWNSLPHVITGNLDVTANTFKEKLKTFYYTNCYQYIHVTPAPAIRHPYDRHMAR